MFERIALGFEELGFEDIVTFVFGFLTASACTDDLRHGFGSQVMIAWFYSMVKVEVYRNFSRQSKVSML
jgi:hypothetical protein